MAVNTLKKEFIVKKVTIVSSTLHLLSEFECKPKLALIVPRYATMKHKKIPMSKVQMHIKMYNIPKTESSWFRSSSSSSANKQVEKS